MLFKKKKKLKKEIYKLFFCDEPDIATKFGEYSKEYSDLDSARWAILSTANGWGSNLGRRENGAYEILNNYGTHVSWIIIVNGKGEVFYELYL